MSLEPGQTLSHYRLLSKIGAGGMGEVYLAEDTTLKRKVALKVLPASMADDPARLERFQREAEAIAALNHPNIVTIHSVEDHEGIRFLTMELVEGESLDRKVAPGGLALAEVFDIGVAIADALAAAHDKGIVHRDLKPANVMVTKEGRVKVLDFGLAKLAAGPEAAHQAGATTEAATKHASLTGEGMIVGTVPYMSPEQLSGKAVDHRTDIFSLGVMLYELSVGRRPFTGETSAIITSSILRDTPRPVSEIREDVPRHLGRIIAHCLEKEPRDRVQTSRDVYNELRALRKEVESGTSGQSQVMSATSAQAPSPVSTSSGVAAAAGGSRQWLWAVAGAAVVIVVVAAFWLGGRGGSGARPAGSDAASAAETAALSAPSVTETNSLAVLPFADMSPDKDQEYFSDGLTEELLNALVKIPDLKVAGRTSSFSFKGRNEDLRVIGEKLGVANILEGSVRKSGDRVRITAQLVKAADGFHLWSETYDRTLNDIFAVQDDIAKAVAQALQVTLLGKQKDAPHSDASTYDMILQARFVLQTNNAVNVRRAREILEHALEASPDSAAVWSELGLVHRREGELANTLEESRQALDLEKQALSRALELDPDLAVTNSRMAGVCRDSWDFAEAARYTERALAAEPKNGIVTGNAANLYKMIGRVDEAIVLEEQAVERDPLDVLGYANLSGTYLTAGRLDDAEKAARRSLALTPDTIVGNYVLGVVYLLRGDVPAARSHLDKIATLTGWGEAGHLYIEALLAHTAGDEEASAKAAREYESRFGAEDPTGCATIRAWRGEKDQAFGWLQKSLAAHDPALAQIKTDNLIASLHTDPRWNALLKKIGLPTD